MPNEEMVNQALQKFNLADAAIMKLSEDYLPLKTNGIKDTKAYAAVHEARMDIKGRRVDVQKKGKELREDAIAFQKAVIAEEKRLVGLLQPIEEHLQAEEDKVDNEKARIKAEAEAKEAARIQGRVNVLFDYGCKFNGLDYILDSLAISQDSVKSYSDEDFQSFCLKLQDRVEAEKARVAAEEQKRREEAERLAKVAAEQEAERQRLATIAKAQAEQEAKIKAEQEALERQKREAQAQKEREEAEKKRKAELEAAEKAAAEKARIEEQERVKREAEEKAEKDRLAKLEAERQEALKPDKEKLLAFADAIETVKCPAVSKDVQKVVDEAKTNLTKIANIIRKRTREL
jgi:hypothetical protein